MRVNAAGDGAAPLVIPNIKALKNGYAYVYLSNESNEPVYFDDFKVSDTRGRIIEENHYYAYGLRIEGISSKKFGDEHEGSLTNNYQYQGDYSEMDEDIGWNDFALRNYDAQLGRWVQQDPFNQFSSPYSGMGNDPVNNIDPSGGWAATGIFEGLSSLGRIGVTTLGGAIIGGAIDALSGGDGMKGLLIGAGIGLGSNFVGNIGAVDGALKGAHIAMNVVTNPYVRWAGNTETIQERIARLATEKVNAKLDDWNFYKAKDDIPAGKDKCNKFVYDVLKEAGASAPTTWFRNPFHWYPIRAGQWADPNYYIPNWRVLSKTEIPQPGDIVAEAISYSNGASGHVGIVVKFGQTASQESKPEHLGISNFGFRSDTDQSHDGKGHYRNSTFRRYVPPSSIKLNVNGVPRYEHGRIM